VTLSIDEEDVASQLEVAVESYYGEI